MWIPQPVKNLFGGGGRDENATSREKAVEEQGNLDFFGRDVARKIFSVVGTVDQKIRSRASRVTGGLDVDNGVLGGVVSTFKDRLRAIYPGKWR